MSFVEHNASSSYRVDVAACDQHVLRLHLNENHFLPPTRSFAHHSDVNLYQQGQLHEALAEFHNVNKEQVFVSTGATGVINLWLASTVTPGDRVFVPSPGWGYYRARVATRNGVIETICQVDTGKSFHIDFSNLSDQLMLRSPKLVIFCSPNNPTGQSVEHSCIAELAGEFPDTDFLVDQTYAGFNCSDPHELSAHLGNWKNLHFVRSFSKTYGLAAARIGYLVSNCCHRLKPFEDPFGLPIFSEKAALARLRDHEGLKRANAAMNLAKNLLRTELDRIPQLYGYGSDANFVLVRTPKFTAQGACSALAQENIRVRCVETIPGGQHLRITIAPERHMLRVVDALKRHYQFDAPTV